MSVASRSAGRAERSSDRQVDPRGLRFAAWVTTVVLAVVLLTRSTPLLAVQAVIFVIGAGAGLRYAPYGLLFRWLIRPRVGPPRELEPEAPPRFAQAMGAGFAIIGVIGFASGVPVLGLVATAMALAAAFLNAAFGFCLGCETFLVLRRAGLFRSGLAARS
ncbi:MAG: DUF4395 domain-containing protein [Mycobacteriales bacterium]